MTMEPATGGGRKQRRRARGRVAVTLAEGDDGIPLAWLEGRPSSHRANASLAREIMVGWLDPEVTRVPLSNEDMSRAGFSGDLVDMVEALRGWSPHSPVFPYHFGRFCGPSPLAASWRELARTVPLLVHLVAPDLPDEGTWPDPYEALAMPGARVRAFSGREWIRPILGGWRSLSPMQQDCQRWTMLDMVRGVPLEWVPRDAKGIEAFWDAARMLSVYAELGLDPLRLAAPCRGDWPAFVERCRQVAPGVDWAPGEVGRSEYLTDPATDLASKVLMPLLVHSGWQGEGPVPDPDDIMEPVVAAALRLLYGNKALPAIVGLSWRWHASLAAIAGAMPSDADLARARWPALLPPRARRGILARCLTTAGELRDEGARWRDADGVRGLDHCVASYRAKAHAGRCHVISIRKVRKDGSQRRLATAEVVQEADGTARVVQLRGRRNSDPPAGCAKALARYLRDPVPCVAPRKVSPDPVADRCGYDWRDPALIRRAVEAYGPFLPRGLRGDPAAILREIGVSMGTADGNGA